MRFVLSDKAKEVCEKTLSNSNSVPKRVRKVSVCHFSLSRLITPRGSVYLQTNRMVSMEDVERTIENF